VGRLVVGPYLKLLGYTGLRFTGAEAAARLWERFYRGEVRLVVAFRHCYGMDPQLMAASVVKGLRLNRAPGLPKTPFVQFVYSSDVGWWAGALARWVIPRAGGLPIDHGRMGPASVDAIRKAIAESPQPVTLAPEGGVSYFARTVVRLEPGFARLGFLAADDLSRQGRQEPVLVLPVSFLQEYPKTLARDLDRALAVLERRVSGTVGTGAPWERVRAVKKNLLVRADQFYRTYYGYRPADDADPDLAVWEHALTLAETQLGLGHDGDFFLRMGRIRTAGWERQFVDPELWRRGTALDRALLWRVANDAWSAFRHNEAAELGWWLRHENPGPEASLATVADQLENLADLLGRLEGGNLGNRPLLFRKRIRTIFGAPLDLSARLDDYRKQRKETLARTVDDLARAWTEDLKEADRG